MADPPARSSSSSGAAAAASSSAPSSSASSLSSSSSAFPVLPFHQQVLDELAAQDGLVILARGLGLPQLLYHVISQYACSSRLVFVLNVSQEQQREINERLSIEQQSKLLAAAPSSSSSPPPRFGRLKPINNQVSAVERQKLYLEGGCLAITNRILIVDLLNRVIAPDLVSGLIINAAHRCTDESSEAFILRIFRESNRHGFIKAFSDEPAQFSSGFFSLDKIMRAMHLRSLSLYPRFHLSVQSSLSPSSLDVHEMYQPLTPAMDLLQRSLVECMDLCISALKQENKLGASILNITIDSGLSTQFDSIIRRELDPIWHKVSPRSRQLIADLGALRQCIGYLINYDSVTFYRYLLTVRMQCQASSYSMWLLTEPADRLFKLAKSRVYEFESALVRKAEGEVEKSQVLARARMSVEETKGKKRKGASSERLAKRRGSSAQPVEVVDVEEEKEEGKEEEEKKEGQEGAVGDRIKLVLEENPKWTLLVDILEEIEQEVKSAHQQRRMKAEQKQTDDEDGKDGKKESKEGRVLICCHDERTCVLLKRYLEEGGRKMMTQLWRNFLYKQRARRGTKSVPPPSTSSLAPPLPAQVPAASPAAPSPWALMAAETAALRALLDRVIERRRAARLKKHERERRRRMEREAEAKRRTEIGHDQLTLTQHVRGVEDKKKKEEQAASKRQERERKRKADRRAKQDRLASLQRDDEEDDGILRDVLMMRDKRLQRIEDMDGDEDDDEDMDAAEHAEHELKRKEDDWGVLSVCDVSLHLTQVDDDSLPSTQSSFPAPPAPVVSSVYHEFDESILHALPAFQILFHPSQDVNLMLYRFQPHFIVMFDPDLTLLRELEVYAAYHRFLPISVYYCQYTNSVEEQRYLAAIKHEKDAFDQLIFQKAHMIVPSDVEGKSVGLSGGAMSVERTSAMRMPSGSIDDAGGMRFSTFEAYASTIKSKGTAVNTRRGGDMSVQVTGKVIVDVREFRSSLPSLLHSRGLTIIPVTLEVGDYVLSPHICVERKSLSDLFSSFLSGRLYKQMEIMTRHYKSPVLLIEFDRKRPFALLSKGELGSDINSRHIMAKIAVLCIHFPQVRFVWSRDSYVTSQMFLMLKKNQFEPDVDGVVLSVGGEASLGMVSVSGIGGGGAGLAGEDDDERTYSMMSFDILRKLPGVTAANMRQIVENVSSLKDLCSRKLHDLMLWMGETNARKLFAFLHSDFSSLFM